MSIEKKFDAAFWKAANAAVDEALDLSLDEREAYLTTLTESSPLVAAEVKRLLGQMKSYAAHKVGSPSQTLAIRTRPGEENTHSAHFDDLLNKALISPLATIKKLRAEGDLCGHWRLERLIGSGGMGDVWLASRADGLYDAKVAVKLLRPESNIQGLEVRFAQERTLHARMNHPSIARLLDAGSIDDCAYLVLEYVEGTPLLEYIEHKASTVEQRLSILSQIASAVSYAHTQLVVHRDLKPSNVLIAANGEAKLLDFGVAGLLNAPDSVQTTESPATKLAGRGLTVEYAAPEQIAGESSGVSGDIYSLGALGFHMLTGRRAHLPSTPGRAALEHAILHIDAPRVSRTLKAHANVQSGDAISAPSNRDRVNADIDAIIARAMRRDPASRYRTVDEFLSDINNFLTHRPIGVRREDRAYRARLWLRRNWLPAALGASLGLALLGGLATSMWQAERARVEATRATKTADYLVDLLVNADPDMNEGKWPTALTLLERARLDVGSRFVNDPATEERLSSMLSRTFRSLSRDTEALPIAKRALALSEQIYGEDALQTALTRFTYADILYWLEDEKTALVEIDRALNTLTAKLETTDQRLLQAKVTRANILARLFRFTESEQAYQEVFAILKSMPDNVWALARAESNYARSLTSQGRWVEAYEILRRNEARFRSPPPGAEKFALHSLQSLASTQVVIGRYDGAEARLLTIKDEWAKLAGPQSMQVFDIHNELGFLYFRLGDGEKSEQTYRTLRTLQDRLPDFDDLRKISTDIDILEVQTLFARRSLSDIRARAEQLSVAIAQLAREKSERGVWLYTRLSLILDACYDAPKAQNLLVRARAIASELALVPGPWVNRIERAEAGIDRRTRAKDSSERLEKVRNITAAAQRGGYSQRMLGAQLEFALSIAEKDQSRARQALEAARATLPASLPEHHYARALVNYVEAIVNQPANVELISERRSALAQALGHGDASRVQMPLPTFFFL